MTDSQPANPQLPHVSTEIAEHGYVWHCPNERCHAAYFNVNRPAHLATTCEVCGTEYVINPQADYMAEVVSCGHCGEAMPRFASFGHVCPAKAASVEAGHRLLRMIEQQTNEPWVQYNATAPHGWAWVEHTARPPFNSKHFGQWLIEHQLERLFTEFVDDEALRQLQTWHPYFRATANEQDEVLNLRELADEVARLERDGTHAQFMAALDDYTWALDQLADRVRKYTLEHPHHTEAEVVALPRCEQ